MDETRREPPRATPHRRPRGEPQPGRRDFLADRAARSPAARSCCSPAATRSPRPPPPAGRDKGEEATTGTRTGGPTSSTREKCIGCGSCVRACKAENGVPDGFFRTWVERYLVSPEALARGLAERRARRLRRRCRRRSTPTKAFFVPKMCNHCKETPCVQVCPVGRVLPHEGRRGARRRRALHRLRLLRPGLPVRQPLHHAGRPTPPRSAPGATTGSPRG